MAEILIRAAIDTLLVLVAFWFGARWGCRVTLRNLLKAENGIQVTTSLRFLSLHVSAVADQLRNFWNRGGVSGKVASFSNDLMEVAGRLEDWATRLKGNDRG